MDLMQRQWEEQGLRAAVLAGDERAWRTLYDQHFDALFAYVRVRTQGDTHRTEDTVQDCWMIAVRRIRTFDPARGPFGAWLRGIADRLLLNERRRWARRQRLSGEVPTGPREETLTDDSEAEQVEQTLAALPEHYREVLCAKYEQGRSVASIAETRKLSEKAVESLLSRARQAFRVAWRRPGSKDA